MTVALPRQALPTDPAGLEFLVDTLTRGCLLDEAGPRFGWPADALESAARLAFVRLRGAARHGAIPPLTVPPSILAGWALAGVPVAFGLVNDDEQVAAVAGASQPQLAGLGRALAGALGGPEPASLTSQPDWSAYAAAGCLSGVPRRADACGLVGVRAAPAEVLLEALRGQRFALLAVATPEPVASVRACLDHLRSAVQEVDRVYLQVGPQGNTNRAARHARDLLDTAVCRLEEGLTGGLWRVSCVLLADSSLAVSQGLNLLCGALEESGRKVVAPLRGFPCGPGRDGASVHVNVLTAAELASLCPLPARDRPGYQVTQSASFDLEQPVASAPSLDLGALVDGDRATSQSFRLPASILTRHALVAGHTGSGKSTTVRTLLTGLAEQAIPFLVLEPAKAEYRTLESAVPDLAVFCLGAVPAADAVPFRLNPLFFPEGFPLHTHIDFVKQAFVASFGLYPPAPYLLETAIYQAYARRGWDLATGTHPNGHDRLSFPTLSDLLSAIDPVVEEAGYAPEVTDNLRAALKTRVGNLCVGPKGMALDTRENLPDEYLFGRPVVLELRHLGADPEKALAMGLVITRLYEVREVKGPGNGALRHLLVLEEAHRLLRRTVERSTEEGNMTHQAVELFANVLAEVRAYGQGVLVVEQIPAKLTLDVVKQASLKLVHRLTPREDRDLLGDAMVLTGGQKRALAVLPTGEAVVHAEGMDGAVRLRLHPPGSPVRDRAASDRSAAAWPRLADADRHRLLASGRRCHLIGRLGNRDLASLADRLVLGAIVGHVPREWPGDLLRSAQHLATPAGGAAVAADELARLALHDAVLRRALYYHWRSDQAESVCAHSSDAARLSSCLRDLLHGPEDRHPWCSGCPTPCAVAYEAAQLAADQAFQQAVDDIRDHDSVRWGGLLLAAVGTAASRLYQWPPPVPPALALCAVGRTLATYPISRHALAEVVDLVRQAAGGPR